MKKIQSLEELKPYRSLILVRIFLDFLKMNPVLVGILALLVYWVVTMVAYFIGTDFLQGWSYEKINIPAIFKLHFDIFNETDVAVTFFEDKSHFAFSFLAVFPGTVIAVFFLKNLKKELIQFFLNDTLKISKEEENKFAVRLQKKYDSLLAHTVSAIIGFMTLIVFLNFAFSDKYSEWWGHIDNSLGGILLALIEAVLMYHAVFLLYTGYVTVKAINQLMEYPVILHQFHPDNCNGFKPLGNIILYLYALSIIMAIAVFIVLYLGFLGLQNTILVWLLVIFCLFLIPLFIFIPTYSVWNKLRFEKQKKIQSLEKRLYRIITRIEQNIDEDGEDDELKLSIEDLLQIKESFDVYDDINVWPYNAKIIQTITATYILEIGLVLYEFF